MKKIKKNIPVESIILCGSKALGKSLSKNSDYDIIVVMKTFLVPFYIKKIKKIEEELKNIGVNASINPLPILRIRYSKGNLFLYKVKLEGRTLYGKDFLNEIDAGDLRKMPPRRFFSYLFSGAKELIKNFDPENKSPSRILLYDSAKAIIYCAETLLMTKGLYFTNKNDMIDYLDGELRKDFEASLNIINDRSTNIDPVYLWLRARNHVISVFLKLMEIFYKAKDDVIEVYLRDNDYRFFKNLEYIILTFFIKKKSNIKPIFSKKSVEKKMFESLLLLLLSIDRDNYKIIIEKDYLKDCIKILNSFIKINDNNKDKKKLWYCARDKILENWQYACSVMGV